MALDKKTLSTHHRVTSLIENLTAGLFLVDQKGKITDVNTALANLLGIEKQVLMQRPYHELFAQLVLIATEPEVVQQWLGAAVRSVIQKPSVEVTTRDEHRRYLEISFFPVWDDDGHPLGWGGLVQDITEMREQTAWKFELLSILAHDLRAPLATLKGQATALLAHHAYWSREMVTEFLEAINRGVDTLTHQVEQDLALTRVETGRLGLRPEATAPEALIQQALERAAGILEDIPVEVHIEGLPNVRVDPARMEEVIVNLLENAARYMPAETPILIQAKSDENWVEFSIINQGPGIPEDKQGVIFEKHVRGKQESHTGSGTGLGLYISRKIVEAHGGRIWVQSPAPELGSGAKFTFSAPIMPEISIQSGSHAGISADLTGKGLRVLIVEDEMDFQAVLRAVLEEEEYELDYAMDGQTAIQIIQSSPPDIVLLDWLLPGTDGLTVCRNIRRWSNVPVIMITSRTSPQDILAAFNAGVDDYITKPFVGGELKARMRALIRRGEGGGTLDGRALENNRRMVGGLMVDFDLRTVWRDGEVVSLTATEFDLFEVLVRHPRQVMTYDQLIEHVWKSGAEGTRHALSVHISRLRNKIEKEPKAPRYIQTRWGVGYFFVENIS